MADEKKRRGKNDLTLYVAVSAAIVLFAVIFVLIARSSGDGDEVTQAATTAKVTDAAATTAAKTETTAPVTEKATEIATETAIATETETPVDIAEYTGVPYSGAADLSVLAKSVFIGDSRTKGLPLYTQILSSGARVYANEGLSLLNISTTEFVSAGENKITALDALRANTDYDSVYISLGINELGLDINYIDSWVARYAGLIDTLREINPNAEIYVQAIIPVSKEESDSSDIFTKERIDIYNSHILELAKTAGVNFLNTDEMFTDSDGYLPAEGDAGDGIHVNRAYSEKWLTYIIEHRA